MNADKQSQTRRHLFERAISVADALLLIGLLVSISWTLYFIIETIALPYPLEYREGAAQVLNQILLKGGNPFSIRYQPLGMNNYGIVYSLAVYPLVVLFGNVLAVYRSVTFFFLICIGVLIFLIAFKNTKGFFFALACGTIVFISLTGRGGIGAFPSALGTLLFLIAILVPFNRTFDYTSLLVGALASVLAYYTKPYFVLSAGIVASYLFLFISKKKGLFFGIAFGLIFAIAYLVVRHFFELYFIDTFLSNIDNDAGRSLDYLYVQLMELGKEFYPVVILFAILVIRKATRHKTPFNLKDSIPQFNIAALNQPLICMPINYFAYVFFCSLSVFILILGPHPQFMVYAYQIVVPPFCLWLFQHIKSSDRINILSVPLILFNIIILIFTLLNPGFLSQRNLWVWNRLYKEIDASKNVLNSPAITSALVEGNMTPVDSGQTEYFYDIRPYPPIPILGPDYDLINKAKVGYQEMILQAIENREYDKVILTKDGWMYNLISPTLNQYYVLTDTLLVRMPQTNQHWSLQIWEPKENN